MNVRMNDQKTYKLMIILLCIISTKTSRMIPAYKGLIDLCVDSHPVGVWSACPSQNAAQIKRSMNKYYWWLYSLLWRFTPETHVGLENRSISFTRCQKHSPVPPGIIEWTYSHKTQYIYLFLFNFVTTTILKTVYNFRKLTDANTQFTVIILYILITLVAILYSCSLKHVRYYAGYFDRVMTLIGKVLLAIRLTIT